MYTLSSATTAFHTPQARRDFLAGLWRLADPKVTLASMSAIFLGACAAARSGPLSWKRLAWIVAGIFFIEVAKNASGDIVDFDSGTDHGILPEDRTPFSGGKRVMVDGLLSRQETTVIAGVFYALGAACGLWIVLRYEPWVFPLGLAGMALAYFYHAPPLSLSYQGFGELAVGLAYGPLIGSGAYAVLRGVPSWPVVLLFAPLGLLIAAFLWINEFPDCDADRAAGKKTWVVRLGKRRAARVFGGLIAAAGLTSLALPLTGWGASVLLGLPGVAAGAWAAMRLPGSYDETKNLIPLQALTLLAFLLLSFGSGIGLLLSAPVVP